MKVQSLHRSNHHQQGNKNCNKNCDNKNRAICLLFSLSQETKRLTAGARSEEINKQLSESIQQANLAFMNEH